ncbi:actin cytoskeleton-regulatory complex protein PAN1, partial [Biomphalaria glabrata]
NEMSHASKGGKASKMSAQSNVKDSSVCIKQGVLRLKKSSFSLAKWSSRHVVLTPSALYMYKNEQTTTPRSVLWLKDYIQAIPAGSDSFVLMASPNVNSKEVVEYKTFSCDSEADMRNWIAALVTQMSMVRNELSLPIMPECETVEHTYEDIDCSGAISDQHSKSVVTKSQKEAKAQKVKAGLVQCVEQLSLTTQDLSQSILYLATFKNNTPDVIQSALNSPNQPTGSMPDSHLSSESENETQATGTASIVSKKTHETSSLASSKETNSHGSSAESAPCQKRHFHIDLVDGNPGSDYVIMKSPTEQINAARVFEDGLHINYSENQGN